VSEDPSPYEGTTPVASLGQTDGAVTLVEGQTFCLSGRTGDLSPDFPHGLFMLDTRVLSQWQLRVNGHPIEPLAVDATTPFAATFVGRARPTPGRADSEIVVRRLRHVGWGMRERVTVTNHGLGPAPVTVELRCAVDFADLFSVKDGRARHSIGGVCEPTSMGLRFTPQDAGVSRSVEVEADTVAIVEAGLITWPATVAPGDTWEVCIEVRATLGGEAIDPRFRCGGSDVEAMPEQRLASWRAGLPEIDTDHRGLAGAVRRAGEDLGALRIFDPDHPEVPIVAAGAPWFMTVFGRDSLITAWMTLVADPSLAAGVLQTLARFQGTEVQRRTEEEPGRILHEMRFASAGGMSLGGGDVYFGSVDATPLFVMLLGELWRWDLAGDVVDQLLPHADRALAWIEEYGDLDGDGYVEYQCRSEQGLANQGWKDSWDAIRFAEGPLAEAPIALCEVQGYVYAAFVARADMARARGDDATAQRFQEKADALRRRFNEDFWLEARGAYALGLDADKRPIDAIASNMGHCLWTGIVDPDRAPAVAAHLMSDGLFSGWGIRTLSSGMAAYNPISYHNGSVWPHDNALCAAGLARYGEVEAAQRVIGAQLDVADAYHDRLPELFAGFDRGDPSTPAAYPTSCSPQAWAAAAPLLWIRTLLQLDPWAPSGTVWIDPALPPWIRRLRVDGIAVAGQRLTVEIDDGEVSVTGAGRLEVVRGRRPDLPGRG
jgi:glycogen debranching enzyme